MSQHLLSLFHLHGLSTDLLKERGFSAAGRCVLQSPREHRDITPVRIARHRQGTTPAVTVTMMTCINTMNANGTQYGRIGVLAGLFMLAHGVMHIMLLGTPTIDGMPGNFLTQNGTSWLFEGMGLGAPVIDGIGTILAIASGLSWSLAGLGFLGALKVSWTRMMALGGLLSLFTLSVFWNDWMVAGPVIDIVALGLLLRAERGASRKVMGVRQ